MSYIAVDLKVVEGLAGQVARSSGTSEDRILAGLVRLWHRCWATTSEVATRAHLAGVMGGESIDCVIEALVELGFLEPQDGGWRVRGAKRYLRLKAARKAGAEKTNAARSRATTKPRSRASMSVAQASLPDALSPSTEHRAPNTEALPPAAPVAAPKVTREVTDALCADFTDVTGQRYLWSGEKDSAGLKALLGVATLEEVRSRWRRGLAAPADEWASCRTVAQLRSKWNDLADAKAAPRLSIEHQPSRIL